MVEVSGPKKLISRIQEKKIIPYVRVNSDLTEPAQLDVSVDLPKGLELVVVEPASITISPTAGSQQK
jgi:hypothetical protein